jgi:hypothetical protein
MSRRSKTRPEDYTELEHELARKIMLEVVMSHTTPGMLLEVDHGVWLPCPEMSSRMFH